MILVSIVVAALAVALLLPTVSDLVSLAKLVVRRTGRGVGSTERPRILFLVPAHDEELLISKTIRSLLSQRYPRDHMHVVVVADNCTDRTADVARGEGAECLERTDYERRGKPYALEWALARLPLSQFDAVTIIDADAVVDAAFAEALAEAAPLNDKAIQTYNDVSNRGENALTRMAAVFGAARVFMNELKHRVDLNSPMSNGLCLGTSLLARHGWQAFSICEDWELYAILTQHGERVESVAGARVGAQEAKSLKQSSSQRKRWAAGKLTVLRRHALPILRGARSTHQKLDAIAELLQIGPAVHFGLVLILSLLFWWSNVPGHRTLVALLGVSLVRPAVYTIFGISVDREPVRAMLAFTYLPLYTVWRVGVQLRALAMLGNKPWVRTARHAGTELTTNASHGAE